MSGPGFFARKFAEIDPGSWNSITSSLGRDVAAESVASVNMRSGGS
jgi:hypothetical protein